MTMQSGKFIVLEGVDGAGTTTQARAIVDWLEGKGHRVHLTGEPTTGPIGTLLRHIMAGRVCSRSLSGVAEPMKPEVLALLFAADRLDHLQNEVVPYLEAGYFVVCDRYVVSSLAYQSVDVDLGFVRQINEKARTPDVTFFLEVSAETAMERIARRSLERDSFENLTFLSKVVTTYRDIFDDYRDGRVLMLDGEERSDEVTGRITAELEAWL